MHCSVQNALISQSWTESRFWLVGFCKARLCSLIFYSIIYPYESWEALDWTGCDWEIPCWSGSCAVCSTAGTRPVIKAGRVSITELSQTIQRIFTRFIDTQQRFNSICGCRHTTTTTNIQNTLNLCRALERSRQIVLSETMRIMTNYDNLVNWERRVSRLQKRIRHPGKNIWFLDCIKRSLAIGHGYRYGHGSHSL